MTLSGFATPCYVLSRSVVPDFLRPHGLQPTRLLSVHGIFQARVLEWVAIALVEASSNGLCSLLLVFLFFLFFFNLLDLLGGT